jgi:16S rRNA (guanine527-N7)-methyltransferase
LTTATDLTGVLQEAQQLGFLGPRAVADQIAHARAFAEVLETARVGPAAFLDLGSGGGLPGLVLADRWPDHRATLVDSSQRRTSFLRRSVAALGWSHRVVVVEGRAEQIAHDPAFRARFRLVVARSFATPSVTAEIGGAFVADPGCLAVSEPNTGDADESGSSKLPLRRWPAEELAELGLGPAILRQGAGARVAIISRQTPTADRWPRGVGIPTKRPLW